MTEQAPNEPWDLEHRLMVAEGQMTTLPISDFDAAYTAQVLRDALDTLRTHSMPDREALARIIVRAGDFDTPTHQITESFYRNAYRAADAIIAVINDDL